MSNRLLALIGPTDYQCLIQAVCDTAREYEDIIGVLAVGTLVQSSIPDGFFIPRYNTLRGRAYEFIRNPGRRRLAIREESDLDLWICVRDTKASIAAQERVELGAVALLSELASNTISWGTVHWRNKKEAVFCSYYKNKALFPESFVTANGNDSPWLAQRFKDELEERVIKYLPRSADILNRTFQKKVPGDFFEIRAFPESLFHLRPDDTVMPNMQEDRMPFPRICDEQWISPSHSSVVMYSTNESSIYPFRPDGRILGSRIAEYLSSDESGGYERSYGGLVIKPDAVHKQQVDIILAKIYAEISRFNGRIVVQKRLFNVTAAQVEIMYPLLNGRELNEAKEYLVGGILIVLIIEADCVASELFKKINDIKGPRLVDRSYERLMEGRILNGSIRDLLPIPGDEELYKAILPTILSKRADPTVRFSPKDYRYYAQNLVHSPDNEIELRGLFQLAEYFPH